MKQKSTIEGWVARDKNGILYLYEQKPHKVLIEWICFQGRTFVLNCDLFPSVKWEDSEPTKCKLTIEI